MTSSQHGSYVQGYTHATMDITVRSHPARGSRPLKLPQFRLHSATRVHEVGVASNRVSA